MKDKKTEVMTFIPQKEVETNSNAKTMQNENKQDGEFGKDSVYLKILLLLLLCLLLFVFQKQRPRIYHLSNQVIPEHISQVPE